MLHVGGAPHDHIEAVQGSFAYGGVFSGPLLGRLGEWF
jgi:hypothetical protein